MIHNRFISKLSILSAYNGRLDKRAPVHGFILFIHHPLRGRLSSSPDQRKVDEGRLIKLVKEAS